LGGTLIEREQQFGYWETLLTAVHAGEQITFRNLGWSGDTVWGESRGLFEPHLGYERLLEQVRDVNPTIVLIAYGNNEAFDGEQRRDAFVAQYARLLDDIQSVDRRLVLILPLEMEAAAFPAGPAADDPIVTAYNREVARYADAIRNLAGDRRLPVIDLRPKQQASQAAGDPPLTFNGLHLTDAGYRQTARWLVEQTSPAASVSDFDFDTVPAAELRSAILAKNELFFHRWRPQNFTYLFGFRKYEQGQNAVEIPQFDPLIEDAEKHIDALAAAAAKR
ncbi:MAG: hypothetical protein KF861_02210, partial [Planctomycetaceae bacterium]|nr:hypothetical protein [Planctomycetaceae bacterium]